MSAPDGSPTLESVSQFVYGEARMIDEKRWDEWAALFTEDGMYWMPATPDQPDPESHVSLMYEDALLRAIRLRRYSHPNALSLQPHPRSLHLVSNVMLDAFDDSTSVCHVNSRQIMVEYRRDEQQVLAAAVTHHLQWVDDDFKIKLKKVDLVNCDGALESIQIYL